MKIFVKRGSESGTRKRGINHMEYRSFILYYYTSSEISLYKSNTLD